MESDISRMCIKTATDGVVVYKDPMTRKVKKNRHRHVKDGAPKNMRGKPREG